MTRSLWPTADDVARAVVAAAREMQVDPVLVHTPGWLGTVGFNRARIYAALALRTIWNDNTTPGGPGNVAFSTMVGGNRNLLSRYDGDARVGNLRWFRTDTLERVIKAVLEAPAPTTAPIDEEARSLASPQTLGQAPVLTQDAPTTLLSPVTGPFLSRSQSQPVETPIEASFPAFLPARKPPTEGQARVDALIPVPKALPPRRTPAAVVEDVTAEFMGDPAPGRSALAEYVEREKLRQLKLKEEAEEFVL